MYTNILTFQTPLKRMDYYWDLFCFAFLAYWSESYLQGPFVFTMFGFTAVFTGSNHGHHHFRSCTVSYQTEVFPLVHHLVLIQQNELDTVNTGEVAPQPCSRVRNTGRQRVITVRTFFVTLPTKAPAVGLAVTCMTPQSSWERSGLLDCPHPIATSPKAPSPSASVNLTHTQTADVERKALRASAIPLSQHLSVANDTALMVLLPSIRIAGTSLCFFKTDNRFLD